MNQNIINAVRNRNIISFIYKNLPRVVEPHAYGETKDGGERLRAYQIGGQSDSRTVPCWGLFKIEEMENINVLADTFDGPEAGYNRGDKVMSIIYAEL
jgi:hypothetical protein